jgi:hypothetical protein
MTKPANEAELGALLAEAAEVDQTEAATALAGILTELERIEYAEPV